MMTIVDARGMACPQPVIETRKAMQGTDRLVTLVDSETSLTNVSRMAEKAGWQVHVKTEGDEFHIEMVKGLSASETQPFAVGRAEVLGRPWEPEASWQEVLHSGRWCILPLWNRPGHRSGCGKQHRWYHSVVGQ